MSYEDLAQLQRLRSANLKGGLATLGEDWEDSDSEVETHISETFDVIGILP